MCGGDGGGEKKRSWRRVKRGYWPDSGACQEHSCYKRVTFLSAYVGSKALAGVSQATEERERERERECASGHTRHRAAVVREEEFEGESGWQSSSLPERESGRRRGPPSALFWNFPLCDIIHSGSRR